MFDSGGLYCVDWLPAESQPEMTQTPPEYKTHGQDRATNLRDESHAFTPSCVSYADREKARTPPNNGRCLEM